MVRAWTNHGSTNLREIFAILRHDQDSVIPQKLPYGDSVEVSGPEFRENDCQFQRKCVAMMRRFPMGVMLPEWLSRVSVALSRKAGEVCPR